MPEALSARKKLRVRDDVATMDIGLQKLLWVCHNSLKPRLYAMGSFGSSGAAELCASWRKKYPGDPNRASAPSEYFPSTDHFVSPRGSTGASVLSKLFPALFGAVLLQRLALCGILPAMT